MRICLNMYFYSCGLSVATIEYSPICVCICVFVWGGELCVNNITEKNNELINLKFLPKVVYKGQTSSTLVVVQSRSRSGCNFEIFLHLAQCKLLSPISQFATEKEVVIKYVHSCDIGIE